MNSVYSVEGPPGQLVDWLRQPAPAQLRHSLVIGSRCNADLPFLGDYIASLLNEEIPEGQRRWHAFSPQDLWHLAGDPSHRETILKQGTPDPHDGPPDSDIDRIARLLARIGGSILEGQYSLDATNHLPNTFRVCLCSKDHSCPEPCDILINPENHGTRRSLATAIATAFVQWKDAHPLPQRA
jgi:hypothetical protein